MEIKNFLSFSESLYSMAASIAPSNYSKPVRNDEYIVKGVVIEFPDTTQLLFEIVREDYFSDKINYTISTPRNENPLWRVSRDYKLTPLNTIQQFYIDVFGDSIQMENYQEFVFVRCWNTEEDFIENEWEGFIFKSDSDGGFYEIKMKFIIISNPLKQNLRYTPEYFKNSYIDKNTAMWAIRHFYQELPNGITYSDLMILKRKFESYLINIDETKSIVNLRETKVEGTSLLSLIYALSLRDNNILKNLKLTSNNINQCMKYLKLFDSYNGEVKLDLSKSDCDDILDFFQAQIADKYQMVFFSQKRDMPNTNDDDSVCNYSGSYNQDDKYFEILINISDKLNIKEFIGDMKKLKDRLIKFGFEAKGHYWAGRNPDKKRYSAWIYKPMFPKKNLKLK